MKTPTVLTIAGSDPYAGAGIQIDSKTIHELGGYALTAITALTSQNSTGVTALHLTPPEVLQSQIITLLNDIHVDSIKIGMLGSAESVMVVAKILEQYPTTPVILDPIILSSSGRALLSKEGIEAMRERLFPLATLITPNIPECMQLSSIECLDEMQYLLERLNSPAILLKGGHSSDPHTATDHLITAQGIESFSAPKIETTHTHGTGCMLSSAIATYLALGESLSQSVALAKVFLSEQLRNSDINFRYRTEEKKRKEPII